LEDELIDFAALAVHRQAVGVNALVLVKRLLELLAEVFVELGVFLQRFALVLVEAGQKLLVHEEPPVQHPAEEHGGQAQGVEDFDAEAAGRGVEDAQHRRQQRENEAGDEQAGGRAAQVMGDGHFSA
jgi:hypothetical protein